LERFWNAERQAVSSPECAAEVVDRDPHADQLAQRVAGSLMTGMYRNTVEPAFVRIERRGEAPLAGDEQPCSPEHGVCQVALTGFNAFQ
jgi:hypothetical protein